ncbi:MAG: MotA/TolQ/ExbB proton channel family protein [Kiritimatiellae bacterium]|nr:MotA/TolQ/ExbB proton channel family protein [Kiritimatiellia bacterium]
MSNQKKAKWCSWIKILPVAVVAIWMLSAIGSPALAQEAEKAKGPPSTFLDYWELSGPTKWALVGSAIWCTALLIEILLRVRVKVFCPPDITSQLTQVLMVKDYTKAWQLCMDNPSPLSRMMAPGIERIPKGEEAAKEAIMESANIEFDKFRVKNSYLNLNATVNTLLGLFGTISGMIGAFNKMAYAGASGDPAKLAGDIGEALIVTWTGLAIAIIAMYLFYILTNRLKAVISSVQQVINTLIQYINFDEVEPGMVVVSAQMRAAYETGGKGGGAAPSVASSRSAKAAPSAPVAAAKPAVKAEAEVIACPSCGKNISVGSKKCPHCQSEIEWE